MAAAEKKDSAPYKDKTGLLFCRASTRSCGTGLSVWGTPFPPAQHPDVMQRTMLQALGRVERFRFNRFTNCDHSFGNSQGAAVEFLQSQTADVEA